jgi:hypothetical protein
VVIEKEVKVAEEDTGVVHENGERIDPEKPRRRRSVAIEEEVSTQGFIEHLGIPA